MEILIYKLIDPITNEIRYIGKTKNNLQKRLYEHLTKRNLLSKTHKNNWIKSLLYKNIKPIIELVEIVDEINWKEKEIFYIKELKEKGVKLTNTTEGGDGALGTKRTKEANEKRIKTIIEKYGTSAFKHSNETRLNMSKAAKGKKHSDERKEKACLKLKKKLYQYDLENNLIKEWVGVRKCSRELKIDYTTLRYSIINKKILNGFIWLY